MIRPALRGWVLERFGPGEPIQVLASSGLELAEWPMEATAWGQAMMGRYEQALRFGELTNAPWK